MKKFTILFLTVFISLLASCASTKKANAYALSEKQQGIISVASYAATDNTKKLSKEIEFALNAGVTVSELGEILLQSYAYAGFPRSIAAQAVLQEVLDARGAKGVKENYGYLPAEFPAEADRYNYGRDKSNQLFGLSATQTRPEYLDYVSSTDIFLKEHVFADIYSRKVVEDKDRLLATCAMIAAVDNTELQLQAYMNAAMAAGFTEEEMNSFVQIIGKNLGGKAGKSSAKCLEKIRELRKATSSAVSGQ